MRKVSIILGKTIIGLAVCVLIAKGLDSLFEFTAAKASQIKEAIIEVLPKKEVARKEMGLSESIYSAARTYRVDPLILTVIVDKESSGGHSRSLYRFEPALFTRLRSDKNYKSISDSELRMLASSHGAFHILGLTAERECQLHFSELYDVEVSAMCAAKIIRRIDDSLKAKATSERLRETFRRYNGQGRSAEEYASDAMGRLAAILYQRMNG